MKNKTIIAISIIILLYINPVFSEIYKCTIDNQISYQSEPCPNSMPKNIHHLSTFDGWDFGMYISAMKRTARERQLAISPGSHIYISAFNKKILNSKPKERKYTYKTKIMDKFTTVTLFFTKTTQKLYKIKATFHVSQLKYEEREYFYESLSEKLSYKYGKSKNTQSDEFKKSNSINPIGNLLADSIGKSLVGSLQVWGLDTDNIITLSYKKNYHTMASYKLTYKNIPLVRQNKKEVTNTIKQRTNQAIMRDGSKL